MRRLAAAIALVLLGAGHARAQNPAWTATLLVQPFPSPFLADWQRNPQMAVLTVLYTGRSGQSFRVEAFARARSGEVGRVISPPASFAFGPTTQLFTTADLLTWNTERSNGRYVYTVQRTGRLPEGPLQLCARVLDSNGVQLTIVCTDVTIALPDPPQLIFPATTSVVTGAQPVFQWTAVVAPPEIGVTYRVHIVQRLAQQTPAVALAANPSILDQLVSGAPLLTYPVTGLPLETGKEYVWQVEALDQTGLPITRGQGKSEIRTFTVGGPGRPPATLAGFPDTLTVVPGLARLSGLSKAQVTETPFAYVLDGQVLLQLMGAYRGQVRVLLNGLTLDKRSAGAPVFTAGGLQGSLPAGLIPASATGVYVRPSSITYDAQGGLGVTASLALPGTSPVPFSGSLQLTAAGISGRLTAGGVTGAPLASIGAAPAVLRVRQASISLPGGSLNLAGTLDLLGQDVGCAVGSGVVDAAGKVSATIGCRPQNPVTLVPDVTRLDLALTAVSGSYAGDLVSGTSTYQLTAAGQLALDAGGQSCGGALSLTIANGGVTPGQFTPSCEATGQADLGWLSATLSNLTVQKLAYSMANGLDFALQVDVAPSLPALPGMLLPAATGVTVDRNGLSVPATQTAVTRPAVSAGAFALKVTHASLPAFTLSWKDWQSHNAGNFSFGIDGTLAYVGAPGTSLPACLTGSPLVLSGAHLANGVLTASLADHAFSPACEVPVGSGLTVAVTKVSGAAGIQVAAPPALTQAPSIIGALELPAFFDCASGTDRRLSLATAIALGPDGTVTGHVAGVTPPCPVSLPALALTLTNSALDFGTGPGGQTATLSGGATGHFTAGATTVSGSGTVGVDVIAGRLTSGSLSFAGPFELDLPNSPAVLAFTVGGATLDPGGLHVDGRAQLGLPGKVMVSATFDQVVINPQTAALSSGKVLFDAPFALEAGITSSGAGLTWKALPAGAALDVSAGIRVDLPAQVSLTATGLTASGGATAHVLYGGKDLADVAATYSQDFALRLAPAGVGVGSVSLAWQGADVGSIDAQGFHPDLGALATQVLPAQLGLPGTDVAYLQLRDAQGNLLVQSQSTSAGVHITTTSAAPVALVLPALALGRGTPPQLNVTVDLTLDPTGRGVTAGTVTGTVPAGASGFDLGGAGVPFAVDSVRYAATGGTSTFALAGRVALFGGRQAGRVTLQLDATGHLSGNVDEALTPADSIPLMPGFGGLALLVTHVTGSFAGTGFDLGATTTLVVGAGTTGQYRAQATIDVSNQGVRVSRLTLPTGTDSLGTVDLGAIRLGLSNLQIPALAYDPGLARWHFDLVFNASLQFPQLSALALPSVAGVELTENGFSIPQINLSQLSLPAVTVQGFSLTPLAFRTNGPVSVNWFSSQSPVDWGFAFDLGLGFGAGAPPGLEGLSLSVLGAGLSGGVFTGQIESPPLAHPIAIPGGSITGFGGSLAAVTQGSGVVQGVGVTVSGRYAYPALLRCAGAPGDTAASVSVGISAAGRFIGAVTNVAPQCPVQLGPLKVQMTASTLTLADSSGAQSARLAGTASLKLAAPTTPDSVTATGTLTLDLARGRLTDGALQLTRPFRWSVPTVSPLLAFDVTAGRIDSSGLALSGSASLMLDAADSVSATLDNVLLSLADFSVKRGSVTVTNGFAVRAGLDAATSLSWQLVPRNAAPPATGVLIAAPDTVIVDSSGLHLGGGATAAFSYGGKSYSASQMSVRFDSAFALGVSPVAVRKGRASLLVGTDTIAVVNQAGFQPGNIFGVLPLPDSIPLPSGDVAFVRLRDPQTGQVLVSTGTDPQGLKVTTTSAVPLVITALANGGTPPTVNVTFTLVVNRSTFVPVSGSLSVTASGSAPLFDLKQLGLPLDVERVAAVPASGGGYALQLDAKVELPASLGGADLRFTNLTVSPQGLSGHADLGTYSASYAAGLPVVATAALAQAATVQFTGAHVVFGAGSGNAVQLSGTVTAPLFTGAGGSGGSPIFFAGSVSPTAGLVLTVDPSQQPNATLPLGVATFTPRPVGNSPAIQVAASDHAFTLTLSGSLGFPNLGTQLAVTVQGLAIGTGGVTVAGIAAGGGAPQQLTLFGTTLTLKDESTGGTSCPAVAAGYASPVVTLALSGELTFLGNTTTFCGLKVGTDGSFAIAHASLLGRPVDVVPGVVKLSSLSIGSDPTRGPQLTAQVAVTLPAPLGGSTPQQGIITVARDGTITGGATLVLLDPSSPKSWTLGDATIALRGVDLVLDATNFRNSSVQVAASICIKQSACPVAAGTEIDLGGVSGNTLTPGLQVGFDGSVKVPSISVPHPITFDSTFLRLTLTQAHGAPASPAPGATGPAPFVITVDGSVGLNLNAVSGGLDFTGIQISSDGHVKLDLSSIRGGDLNIGQSVDISVTQVAYSARDTIIGVPDGSKPTSAQDPTGHSSRDSVTVHALLSFGANVSVAHAFSGGVKQVLVYRDAANGSHILIDGAHFDVTGVVSMQADLRYDQSGTGWNILVGGSANAIALGNLGMIVVGNVGEDQQPGGPVTRLGVFLAVTGLHLDLAPTPITVTGLGGGFFINPTQADLLLVQNLCGLADTSGLVKPPATAAFAMLLYGQASIVDANVANGKVLLTVTDQAILIDGGVTVLPAVNAPGVTMNGNAHLKIPIGQSGAAGDLYVNVSYLGILTLNTDLQFQAYSTSAWGISGNVTAHVYGSFDAVGDMSISPAGFFVEGTINGEYTIWIATISGGFSTKLWWVKDAGWGAYVAFDVSASVLDGAVSATGTLAGALVDAPPVYYQGQQVSPGGLLVYASADLHVDYTLGSWDGTVWVQFQNGDLSAGFGDDPAMDAAIAAAQQESQAMATASQQIAGAIAAAKAASYQISIPTSELAAAYTKLTTFQGLVALIGIGLPEQAFMNDLPPGSDASYFTGYTGILTQTGAPGDTTPIQALANAVPAELSTIQAMLPAVQQKLSAIQAQTTQLANTPPPPPAATSPIQVSPGGTGGVPTFTLNAVLAQQQSTAASRGASQAAAYQNAVRQQVQALETGLAQVHAATSGTSSLLDFAQRFDTAERMSEEQFARQVDFVLSRAQWARNQDGWLHGQQQTAANLIASVPHYLVAQNRCTDLRSLVDLLSSTLSGWTGDQSYAQQFAQDKVATPYGCDPLYQQHARDLGTALWYATGDAGLSAMSGTADSIYQVLAQTAGTRLATIRGLHLTVSQQLDQLAQSQARLTGRLYDLYNRLLFWKKQPATLTVATPGTSVGPGSSRPTKSASPSLDDPAAIQSRLTELGNELAVPRLTGIQVTASTATPFMTDLRFTWTATHPTGLTEFVFNDLPTVGQNISGQLFSNGGSGTRDVFLFTTNPDQGVTDQYTFQAGVRGTAGYVGLGSASYTVTFGALVHDVGTTTTVSSGGLNTDNTAPSKPVVWAPGALGITGPDGKPRTWTTDPTTLEAAWMATDNQSGISEYDYALTTGTQSPATWTNAGGRTDVTIPGLHLPAATPTYVNVRAKNGQGITSAIGTSLPVYVDSTPPRWPAGATFGPPPQPMSGATGPSGATGLVKATLAACTVTMPAVPMAPPPASAGTSVAGNGIGAAWSGGLATAATPFVMGPNAVPPLLLLVPPAATDAESGVWDYWWRADRTADSTLDPTQWTALSAGATSVSASWAPLDYLHPYYVSLVARNHAGASSIPLVYGPVTIVDPSPPSRATFCAGAGTGTLVARISAPAADDETGISGYQYRVRDAGTGAVVRAWPGGTGVVDWSGASASSPLATATLALQGGHQYYLDMRAINGQGMAGDVVASGPVYYDATPPPLPTATATLDTAIEVMVVTPLDPESGLMGMQYAVGKSTGAGDVVAWQSVRVLPGPTHQLSIPVGKLLMGDYYVSVRDVNAAGLPSAMATAKFTVSPQAVSLPPGHP